ncbi:E3 SUMO-protein ligase RanBP2 [Morella rubra]|uniref:E3 SUMO-protein ligase RanBP2 n=1 Tax=Morella rubra TaxID=262757 RepID=A0A6A1W2M5_9ROSI|nr:E3 SUMO-protein ligase RanBP2 [Morella rubra]
MEDAENVLPPSKKRAAGRELTKDNAGLDDQEDAPEQETGTFKRASEEVLATRRIVKVRRSQTTSAPSSNPFAGINLVSPTETDASTIVTSVTQASCENAVSNDVDQDNEQSENKTDETENLSSTDKENAVVKENITVGSEGTEAKVDTEQPMKPDEENAVEKENINTGSEGTEAKVDSEQPTKEESAGDKDNDDSKSENLNSGVEGAPLSSFQQLSSSQNAFTGLAGTGISTSTFSFGSVSTDGSTLGTVSVSPFGVKDDKPFGLSLSNNGSSSIFGSSGASTGSKNEGTGFPSRQEVVVETGEEHEKVIFTADSVMFEFVDGGWKERGKGELRVNVSTTGTERARLLMRARGNLRLILNARLYPDMKLTNMEKKGITFACVNSATEGKDGLSTFALKFKDGSIVEEFRAAVTANKDKVSTVLNTPENSPKASDE